MSEDWVGKDISLNITKHYYYLLKIDKSLIPLINLYIITYSFESFVRKRGT